MKPLFCLLFCCLTQLCIAEIVRPGENTYCSKRDVWTGALSDRGAFLPTRCVNTGTRNTPSLGRKIVVPASSDIDGYLAEAQCGDTLLLTPGRYQPFTLSAKGCDAAHWITIRSLSNAFRGPGHRVSPCHAGQASLPGRPEYPCPQPRKLMATISTKPGPDIQSAVGANYYRIGPGIELTRPDEMGISFKLVVLAGGDHIIFDRVWVHGTELPAETQVGFDFTGATNVAIVNSYLNNFKCIAGAGGSCTDAHAIGGGDNPAGLPQGIWKVYNNFIEASGESMMFGGALHGTATPEDIEIRLNYMYKVPSWNRNDPGYVQPYPGFNGYIAKNLFELKNARRVLVEGNLMEYSWGGYTQSGQAIVLTPRGAWAHVEDVTIRFVKISHVGSGFQLRASRSCTPSKGDPTQCKNGSGPVTDSGGAARWSLHDIVVDDVNADYYVGNGSMAQVSSAFRQNAPLTDVVLDHITFVTDGVEGLIMTLGTYPENPQPQMGAFTFTNSIVRAGEYNGIWKVDRASTCVTKADPTATFSNCFTQHNVTRNLIVGWGYKHHAAPWPDGNVTPADYETVFVSPALSGGDYHVLAPYQKSGSDGKDVGADIESIEAYTNLRR